MATREPPYPFVKWAGGKARMAKHILEHIPLSFNRYFEPFLGGGALFFELARQKRFQKATLGDLNPDLMNAYRIIKDDVDGLVKELGSGKYVYDRKKYLAIREEKPIAPFERAARFIYLNKTGFNGLYRVNQDGGFNVPFGDYDDPIICDEANLRAIAKTLKKVKLIENRFEWVLKDAKPGDLVYFDPPYLPISKTSNFTGYTKAGFGMTDHTYLSLVFDELADRGVSVICSNSVSARHLYSKRKVVELVGSRSVGGPAEYRKPVKEIMVVANCRIPEVALSAGV